MLTQRIATAVILGILVIINIFYLPLIAFGMLAALIVSLAAWEFAGLFWQKNYKKKISFLALFLLICALTQFVPAEPTLIVGVLWWLTIPYVLWKYSAQAQACSYQSYKIWLVGMIIFVPCFVGLIELQEKFGPGFLLYLLAIVCAADIGAYFTGMFFGKRLLAPKISPKKTLEGLLGGLLLSSVIAVICALFNFSGMRFVSFLMLAVVTCLWSVIGDLFESMLKRQAGVKDSGWLLPGHGGVYDRIDSLTAAIPIFVLGLLII